MAKVRTEYVCQACGNVTSRWQGKCDACGEWNTISESLNNAGVASGPQTSKREGRRINLVSLAAEVDNPPRLQSGLAEFDRVTGGGFVPGSAILLGGDPGIGKSTLLMQAAAKMASNGHSVVYVSGEEAVSQVQLRAQRLGAGNAPVQLAAATNVEDIIATVSGGNPPNLLILDSVQTLWTGLAESAPGTVTQVRAASQALIRYAKSGGTAIVLVGHVTKDGQIAGPRVVEHMVDAVLYFEGEGGHSYRILRGVKNRFGATNEIGVFEMSANGLQQVANPSELFLGERRDNAPGAAVFAGMEGTRPVLVEVQALVAPSPLGTPRRAVVGWDNARLSMILAVLEAHCGVKLSTHDVYLNIAGGYRTKEPATDLAVAAALISSLSGVALALDCVYFGEVSLSGAVRPVGHEVQRLNEADKLGFSKAVLAGGGALKGTSYAGKTHRLKTLMDLVTSIVGPKQRE